MVTHHVEWNHPEGWIGSKFAPNEFQTRTEAERAASVRSENGLIYRVRKGNQTVSKFQHGKQLAKETDA